MIVEFFDVFDESSLPDQKVLESEKHDCHVRGLPPCKIPKDLEVFVGFLHQLGDFFSGGTGMKLVVRAFRTYGFADDLTQDHEKQVCRAIHRDSIRDVAIVIVKI